MIILHIRVPITIKITKTITNLKRQYTELLSKRKHFNNTLHFSLKKKKKKKGKGQKNKKLKKTLNTNASVQAFQPLQPFTLIALMRCNLIFL